VDGSVWVEDAERGMVISFNGEATGAYVRAGTIPQMTLTNDFTWVFWAKQDAGNTTTNDIIFGNRKDENAVDFVPRQFIKFTPTKFEWHMNGNGNDNLEYDDIPADVWLHHVVVKDGDQLTYYRNGAVANSGTFTQPLDFPQPLFFGGDNEGASGENWRGFLSDARIYNKALTKLEVLAAMNGVEQINMEIGYAIVPPAIDGEVDAIWASAAAHSFVPLADPADGSGTWKVLYDEENLYVIIDVTDDSLKNDSASAWQDDSVEVYFDGGNTKLSTALSGDDHQYTFGWTATDIQGTNIAGYTAGIEQAQVTTATGWRIEIKMPWTSIQGAAAQAGDLIGIDCYYNDDDDGGDSREGKMLSYSAVEGWNDASQWATAILAAAPKPLDPGAEGLAAYYAFENDVLDGSGNGNDGTIVGNPTWIDGVQGTALEFHGLGAAGGGGDYINCGSGASLDITGPIALSLWIRPDADDPEGKGTETAPMAKAFSTASPSWSYQVRYGWGSSKPYMAFTFNTSPRAWVYVGQKLTQGEWSHIACSHDGATLKCYLDGIETDSTPMGAITSSPAPVLIGSDGWGCDWIGGIDEVAIYNRALSPEEILYLAGFRVPKVDVTAAGDAVVGVPNDGDWPAAETPALAFDNNVNTKFLHFKGETQATGVIVTPSVGSTVVTGLTFTTANDAVERDPIAFELYGSNDSADGPWTLIASGDIVDFAGADPWPRFTINATPIAFANETAYAHYEVLFPAVRNPASANSMQIAEIELLGLLE